MAQRLVLLLLVCFLTKIPSATAESRTTDFFDPKRDILVSEVKPGMKGYGLSIFSGAKIEKFDVDVVAVVKDFNPKYDVILINCPGEYLKYTGPIEGMSGSPIYLYDGTGRARLAGAFAYGWPFSKDCLAGVQPIQYMLRLPTSSASGSEPSATEPATAHPANLQARWNLSELTARPWNPTDIWQKTRSPMANGPMNMRPLATPLMTGGVSSESLARISPIFAGSGLVPMQGGTTISSAATQPAPQLEPGSVLAVPLLTGDMELTAVGTCTERIGNNIFGFGHSFNNEGPIDLPMGAGTIATVVANLSTSFKLGFLSGNTGALMTDQTVGVAGQVGQSAPMSPMTLRIVFDDGSVDETYHFNVAIHPKLTPLISAAAVTMAMTGEKNLPQYHTVDYNVDIQFANGRTVHVGNNSVSADGMDIVADLALPVMAAADNPFQYVPMKSMTGTFRVKNAANAAEILSVMVPQTKYSPGDTVKASISYLPFHAEQAIMPVSFTLPRDLPDGQYQLVVSDWARYLDDEKTANPYKFSADNIKELFSVLRDLAGIKHDAVYLRLVRQADGVAVGHVELSHLPASRMQLMLDSGRSNITPYVTSDVTVAPTGLVMNGSAEFTINVERETKVQTPGSPAGQGK